MKKALVTTEQNKSKDFANSFHIKTVGKFAKFELESQVLTSSFLIYPWLVTTWSLILAGLPCADANSKPQYYEKQQKRTSTNMGCIWKPQKHFTQEKEWNLHSWYCKTIQWSTQSSWTATRQGICNQQKTEELKNSIQIESVGCFLMWSAHRKKVALLGTISGSPQL